MGVVVCVGVILFVEDVEGVREGVPVVLGERDPVRVVVVVLERVGDEDAVRVIVVVVVFERVGLTEGVRDGVDVWEDVCDGVTDAVFVGVAVGVRPPVAVVVTDGV